MFDIPFMVIRPNYCIQNDASLKDPLTNAGIYSMPLSQVGVSAVGVQDIAEATAIVLISDEHYCARPAGAADRGLLPQSPDHPCLYRRRYCPRLAALTTALQPRQSVWFEPHLPKAFGEIKTGVPLRTNVRLDGSRSNSSNRYKSLKGKGIAAIHDYSKQLIRTFKTPAFDTWFSGTEPRPAKQMIGLSGTCARKF
jgi:hypothetical protein